LIIYLDEEKSYRSWVGRHPEGFVVDWLRPPTRRQPMLHRATCAIVRQAKSKRTRWTSGRHLKACSLDLGKLVAWARQESGHEPGYCQDCRPHLPVEQLAQSPHDHVTRLGWHILDTVVEVAVICLDNRDSRYELTIRTVAELLHKSPGQIFAAVWRLVHGGYLRLEPAAAEESQLQADQRVLPTAKSMRTLPAFSDLPESELQQELARLESS
jgi:hypothetical protein